MPRCAFCKRPLRSKKSILLRAGSTCAKRNMGYINARRLELAGQLNLFSRASGAERRRSLRHAHGANKDSKSA